VVELDLPLGGAKVVCGRLAAPTISNDVKRDFLAFVETSKARALYRADVDENVVTAIFGLNEAKAFLTIEPFHGSSLHMSSFPRLGAHARSHQQRTQVENCWKVVGQARQLREAKSFRRKPD